MKRSYLLLLALLLVGLVVVTAVTEVFAICGDVDGNTAVNSSDAEYIMYYLGAGGPAPDFAADADDYDLITIRDAAYLVRYKFESGAAPACPPSHGKYVPVFNGDFDLTHSAVFPANQTQYSFTIHFQRSFSKSIRAFDFPLLIRVDGDAPANLTAFPYSIPGLSFLQVQVNQAGAPSGSLVIVGGKYNGTLNSGRDSLVTVEVTMPTSSPNPRAITFLWLDLPPTQLGVPNNYPMIVDQDLDGWKPALNGIAWGDDVGFYALPTKVDAGMPVFFTGLSTVGVSAWDWDFGDGTQGTGPNPIHSYSSTGVYTVTLVATLAGGGAQAITRTKYIQVNPVKADFTASPRSGSLDVNPTGLLVQFTDVSTSLPTSWLWDFGDPASGVNNTSTLQSPTHTYANPGVYTVQLTASNAGSSDTKIYLNCIHVDAVATPDLQVICYGPERVRRGFHKELDIVVTNFGSADAIGTTLTLDLSLLPAGVTFAGSVPPPETPPFPATVTWNLPTITWDPTQLQFDDYIVKVDLYVDPGVPVPTDILATASVTPATGEVVLTNNIFTEHETVVAAIDPNDKSVQPRGCSSQKAIKGTERLDYLIQFENKPSATADAFYVLVVDTLDPNLDFGSLQLGPSSKDNVLSVSFDPTTREIVWFFNGYDLPPNITPPEGEGFVTFSVMPMPGLPENTVISNRAHIRFDFEDWLAAPEAGPLQLSISSRDLDQNGIIDACEFICGDASGDDIVDISDVVYLIAYIFSGGLAPSPLLAGDANCDGMVDISDVVYLIAYIFSGGLAPCAGC